MKIRLKARHELLKLISIFCFIAIFPVVGLCAQKRKPIDKPISAPKGKSISFYLAKGGRFLETGDYSTAILYLQAALNAPRQRVKPSIIQLAETLHKSALIYQEARILRESGRPESAVENYLQINQLNPVDPKPIEFIIEIYDLLSEGAEKRNDYEEAARLYSNWLKYAPNNEFPRKGVVKNLRAAADAAMSGGNEAKALAYYKKLLEFDPSDKVLADKVASIETERDINAALAKLQLGDLDGAVSDTTILLNSYPNEPRLLENLRLARGRLALNNAEKLMSEYRYLQAAIGFKSALELLPEEGKRLNARLSEIQQRRGLNYRSDGRLRVRGYIKGPAKIRITGKSIETLEGSEKVDAQSSGNALPERPHQGKIEQLRGDVTVSIIETPSRRNNYSIVCQLLPKEGKSFDFILNWELQPTGSVIWRARVEGRAQLRLQGNFIDYKGSASNPAVGFDPLPFEDYALTIEKSVGSDKVLTRIIESPSAANDYAASIEIVASAPEDVELRIDWKRKRK